MYKEQLAKDTVLNFSITDLGGIMDVVSSLSNVYGINM